MLSSSEVFGLEVTASLLLVLCLLYAANSLFSDRAAPNCRIYAVPKEARHRALVLMGCWAAGVLLACSLLDVMPSYLARMTETFSGLGVRLQFPVPEFLLATGFFLVLLMEQVILTFKEQTDGHSNGKEAVLVGSAVTSSHPRCSLSSLQYSKTSHSQDKGPGGHDEYSHLAIFRTFILLFSLSLCSVFEGLAMGSREVELEHSLVLLLHKTLCSVSLGVKLAQCRLRRSIVIICLASFMAMTPLGTALGKSLYLSHSVPLHQAARSALEGLAAGGLMYIVFIDVLPHAMSSRGHRISKVAQLLTGFAAVTLALLMKS